MLYLEYTPVNFPFIIEYESEIESSNGAIIGSWYPLTSSNQSILSSELVVENESNSALKFHDIHFSFLPIEKVITGTTVKYFCKDIVAFKDEQLANYYEELPFKTNAFKCSCRRLYI